MKIINLVNDKLDVTIIPYGARITHWKVDGVDIILGFDDPESYKTAAEPYHGALIGRYANRIAKGKFPLEGHLYHLSQNLGTHTLHGGKSAFHNQEWTIISESTTHVVLQLISADGDQGFPGKLITIVRYELTAHELMLSIQATTDQATPLSITHHPYFNLSGLKSVDLDNHLFKINSNQVLETDVEGIPSGKLIDVDANGFDFREWKTLKNAWQESHDQIILLGGIDHTYITPNQGETQWQAEAKSEDSHVHMQVWSDSPSVQFYTANHFDGSELGKNNRPHRHQSSFCFEPQFYPDSPNQPSFPNTILNSGNTYIQKIIYKFL